MAANRTPRIRPSPLKLSLSRKSIGVLVDLDSSEFELMWILFKIKYPTLARISIFG